MHREQARILLAMLARDEHACARLVSSNVLPMVGRCLAADPHLVARMQYLDLLGVLGTPGQHVDLKLVVVAHVMGAACSCRQQPTPRHHLNHTH